MPGVTNVGSIAYLTSKTEALLPCTGRVHSVFARVANIVLEAAAQPRLITLLAMGMPPVPDGIHMPAALLTSLEEGMLVELGRTTIRLKNGTIPLVWSSCDSLAIRSRQGPPRREEFLAWEGWQGNGFERLPQPVRDAARHGLDTGDIQQWIGLGPGLTPSFDDACVGAMAMCAAAGIPAPFGRVDTTGTTDISMHYLNLAWEGYYGQSVCDVAAALFDRRKPLGQSIQALARHGHTSGRDVLFGMYRMLLRMKAGPGERGRDH